MAIGPPASGDRLLVHAAALGVLSAAAEEAPLLAVVDDAHWLDEASADALLFAARRLEGEPVGLLLALRPVEGRRLDLSGVETLRVEGLARAEAAQLLRGLPPEVIERLHTATAGNPLALLEAPAQLPERQLAGRDPLTDPLPVGPGVQAGYRRRLEKLPPRTRLAMLLFAAAGTESLARIAEAGAQLGVTLADLGPAEADQLVEIEPDRVAFRHPLVRAAAYRDAPSSERRAVHAALAAHTSGTRRANHLWAAATGPDPVAAAALDQAADEARRRTSFSVAALEAERAARLTEAGDVRAARLLAAARDRAMGGDAARAMTIAQAARGDAREAVLTAEIKALLGSLESLTGSLEEGSTACVEAAESIADVAPERAAAMLATAAQACTMSGRVELAHQTAARAYALDPRPEIAVVLGVHRVLAGEDQGDGTSMLLDQWPEVVRPSVLDPGAPQIITTVAALCVTERYDDAEAFAAGVEALIAETGAIGALPRLRAVQAEVDLRRGNWTLARARASESLRMCVETGQIVLRSWSLALLARIEAAMGLEAACRSSCAGALESVHANQWYALNVYSEAALGLLELGLGRAEQAAKHFDEANRWCVEYGLRDPGAHQHHPDRIEAHVRAGHHEHAREALAEVEQMAHGTQRPWLRACIARCHGMLEDDFDHWFERAYVALGDHASPFDLGRTELAHGERLRRARRVREARERLRAAVAHFELVGAASWAQRAAAELRAAGGAPSPMQAPTTRELTPQELEVALAVAAGATNREAAAALFVSPKTVEVHLTRIFKKLGVRSRTELARVVALSAGAMR